jgi:hypothetical protein
MKVHYSHCIEVRGDGEMDKEIVFCCRRTLHKLMALSRKYCYFGAFRLSCKRFIAPELLVVNACVL